MPHPPKPTRCSKLTPPRGGHRPLSAKESLLRKSLQRDRSEESGTEVGRESSGELEPKAQVHDIQSAHVVTSFGQALGYEGGIGNLVQVVMECSLLN